MTLLLGVPFDFQGMSYYQTNKEIQVGDLVVVTTEHGTFVGHVAKVRTPSEEESKKENFDVLFPRIDRIATFQDKAFEENGRVRAKEVVQKTQAQANSLKLDMKILNAYFAVNEPKVLITFAADQRVDFRELVRILNGLFHMKVEFRQVGPRDQARIAGGIGPCGLPLCCSSFLTKFDIISISMAKNQLLALNIPKLSGQCGKLMCCLKFENDAYSALRPLYPKIGTKFAYRSSTYAVTGLNLLTDTITAYNGENYENFTKEEFERVKQGLPKEKEVPLSQNRDINSGVDLSGKGIQDTKRRIAQIQQSEDRRQASLSQHGASSRPAHGGKPNGRPGRNAQRPAGKGHPNAPYAQRPNGNPSNRPNNGNRRNGNGTPNPNYRNSQPHNSHSNGRTPFLPSGHASSSGYIKVSDIQDRSVLERPVKNNKKDGNDPK